MKRIAGVVMAAFFAALGAGLALSQNQSGYDLFQQALVKERAEGNVSEAIQLYQRIVREFSGNRALAAKALVEMGECYEKLGKEEARKAYERVVRDYADQQEQAAEARTRLAALTGGNGSKTREMVTRRVWDGPHGGTVYAPSPDGRYLSFVDWLAGDLVLRDLATGEDRQLVSSHGYIEGQPGASAFSPDGKSIAYGWMNFKEWIAKKERATELRTISVDGSNPRVVCRTHEIDLGPRAWSTDGKWIATVVTRDDGTNQIALMSTVDGSVRTLKSFDWRYPGGRMAFSPDGRFLTYDFPQAADTEARDIFLLAVDGSHETRVISHPANDIFLGWEPNGNRILFLSDRTGSMGVWEVGVTDGIPVSSPELVKPDVGPISPVGLTRKGSLYYTLEFRMQAIHLASFDPVTGRLAGRPVPLAQRLIRDVAAPDWSPDGKELAYRAMPFSGALSAPSAAIVIGSPFTGGERELSCPMKKIFSLRWSPDASSFLLAGYDAKNRYGLNIVDARTCAVKNRIPNAFAGAWSRDGNAIFYAKNPEEHETDRPLMVRNLEKNTDTKLYAGLLGGLAVSPDGREVAFSSFSEKGQHDFTLLVMPTQGGPHRKLFTLPSGEKFITMAWTADGRYLLFVRSMHGEDSLWRIPAAGGAAQPLGALPSGASQLSVHPNGEQIAFAAGSLKTEVWVMENFLTMLRAAK